ncbi:MAG: hypothetical protein GY751_11050 [Bacteroidetes bacterium]|nr:hypothetical protein [Bacteroidota bacterium]
MYSLNQDHIESLAQAIIPTNNPDSDSVSNVIDSYKRFFAEQLSDVLIDNRVNENLLIMRVQEKIRSKSFEARLKPGERINFPTTEMLVAFQTQRLLDMKKGKIIEEKELLDQIGSVISNRSTSYPEMDVFTINDYTIEELFDICYELVATRFSDIVDKNMDGGSCVEYLNDQDRANEWWVNNGRSLTSNGTRMRIYLDKNQLYKRKITTDTVAQSIIDGLSSYAKPANAKLKVEFSPSFSSACYIEILEDTAIDNIGEMFSTIIPNLIDDVYVSGIKDIDSAIPVSKNLETFVLNKQQIPASSLFNRFGDEAFMITFNRNGLERYGVTLMDKDLNIGQRFANTFTPTSFAREAGINKNNVMMVLDHQLSTGPYVLFKGKHDTIKLPKIRYINTEGSNMDDISIIREIRQDITSTNQLLQTNKMMGISNFGIEAVSYSMALILSDIFTQADSKSQFSMRVLLDLVTPLTMTGEWNPITHYGEVKRYKNDFYSMSLVERAGTIMSKAMTGVFQDMSKDTVNISFGTEIKSGSNFDIDSKHLVTAFEKSTKDIKLKGKAHKFDTELKEPKVKPTQAITNIPKFVIQIVANLVKHENDYLNNRFKGPKSKYTKQQSFEYVSFPIIQQVEGNKLNNRILNLLDIDDIDKMFEEHVEKLKNYYELLNMKI